MAILFISKSPKDLENYTDEAGTFLKNKNQQAKDKALEERGKRQSFGGKRAQNESCFERETPAGQNKKPMNVEIAENIVYQLARKGIYSFCICPGGRIAPFVEVLSKSKGLEVLSFFEERSAGFFALGRTERDRRPTAVLTTSGTAVAELLPSVIEACYSAWPLALITADRPLKFGQKGSPQTLKNALQVLKDYCQTSKNITQLKDADISDWPADKGSLHLNVCFDEPLLDKEARCLDFSGWGKKTVSICPSFDSPDKKSAPKEIKAFFKICKKPLLLAGRLKAEERTAVQDILIHYTGPFYAESLSCLENGPGQLLSGEKILNYSWTKKEIDGVIRLGGIPRTRFWKDLEKLSLPVLNLSSPPFYAGLSRPSFNQPLGTSSVRALKTCLLALPPFGDSLKDFDREQLKKWKDILKSHPQSEYVWLLTLKKSLKGDSKIFLGNSSPIRLWSMADFCEKKGLSVTGQAGVNGIDGLVSRFLGGCEEQKNNVGILGDLSLLYDMAGFWGAKRCPAWTLAVINNFGGQIFSRLFNNPSFLNTHKLSFHGLAKMWGLNYSLYSQPSFFKWPDKPYSLVEIRPQAEDTKACFKKYVSLWDSL